jgi:Ni,Fe-hydrogenase III small subunit
VFADSYACVGAVSKVIPVDLVIRGCPPTPTELLQGLLWLFRNAAPAGVNAKRS